MNVMSKQPTDSTRVDPTRRWSAMLGLALVLSPRRVMWGGCLRAGEPRKTGRPFANHPGRQAQKNNAAPTEWKKPARALTDRLVAGAPALTPEGPAARQRRRYDRAAARRPVGPADANAGLSEASWTPDRARNLRRQRIVMPVVRVKLTGHYSRAPALDKEMHGF